MSEASAFAALPGFIAARLGEVEAEARKHQRADGEWARVICDPIIGPFGGQTSTRDIAAGLYVAALSDPVRVLAAVEAKRAILLRCEIRMNEPDQYSNGLVSPRALLARQVLMDLASEWDDHPDYRQEWKP
jgi:hypothetical protein